MNREVICFDAVAPVRERGLKLEHWNHLLVTVSGRSREGAWIEISIDQFLAYAAKVAPVRERGLKSKHIYYFSPKIGRSREGAWIEINVVV